MYTEINVRSFQEKREDGILDRGKKTNDDRSDITFTHYESQSWILHGHAQVALYPTFWCLSVFDVLNLPLSVFSDNFMLFKMDVAKQAINSRSGKAIPPKVR